MTIPIAFEAASDPPGDIGAETRRRTREAFLDGKIMERCACDIRGLLLGASEAEDEPDIDTIFLWDERRPAVTFGVSYGKENDIQVDATEENNGVLVEG